MLDDYDQSGREEWTNPRLDQLLEALGVFSAARVHRAGDQETPTWALFAEMVVVATGYE